MAALAESLVDFQRALLEWLDQYGPVVELADLVGKSPVVVARLPLSAKSAGSRVTASRYLLARLLPPVQPFARLSCVVERSFVPVPTPVMPASTRIPSFAQPPVAEVALSIQFAEPIPIEILDVAVVRDAFVDRYPIVQVKAPISEIEPNFDPLRLDVQLVDEVPLPLFWFLNDDNTELVQFQADRLTVNWRRVGNEPYPRYAEAVRPMAVDAWTRLSRALDKLGLDEPEMGAAEMVYLNPITAGPAWGEGNELRRLLACWSGEFSDDFLPAPDDVRMNLRFTLPDEAGRLLISLQPTRSNTDREPAYMLQLVVRGRVDGDHAAAMAFFDLAREWIVRGFTSVTTPEMHALWGRNHDA